jgi:hypothetical protein
MEYQPEQARRGEQAEAECERLRAINSNLALSSDAPVTVTARTMELNKLLLIERQRAEQAEAALAGPQQHFGDPWNDNRITYCGECHHPCEVVRPGKVQCRHCEDREVAEQVIAENKRLKAALAAGDAFLAEYNSFNNTVEDVQAAADAYRKARRGEHDDPQG